MFKEAPEIFMCEMRLRGAEDSAAAEEAGGDKHGETTTTVTTKQQIAVERLTRIHEMWAEICAEASEGR
jgi:hypothetical protein